MLLRNFYPYFFKLGGLIALLVFCVSSPANEVSEFHLSTCGATKCMKLDSPKAWQSRFTASYAFATATITIFDRESHKELQTITAKDVFYDSFIEKIMIPVPLTGVKGESYYDLKSEQLVVLAQRIK